MDDLPASSTSPYSGFFFPDEPIKLRSALYAFECSDGSASLSPTRPSRKMYLPLFLGGVVIGPVVCWVLVLNWPPAFFRNMAYGNLLFALLVTILGSCFVGIALIAHWYHRGQVRAHLTGPPMLVVNPDGTFRVFGDEVTINSDDIHCIRHVRGTVANELTQNRMLFSQVLLDVGGAVGGPVHIASIGGGAYRLQRELEALAGWLGVRLVREHCSSDETPSYQTMRAHVTDFL